MSSSLASSASPVAEAATEATAPHAGDATQADLYDQVFGGGSDVSELSDEDDEPAASRRLPFPSRPTAVQDDEDDDEEEDDDDDDEEEVDAYVPATESSAAKIPSFKKVREPVDEDEDEEGEEGEEERRERKKKKRKTEKRRRDRDRADEVVVEEEEVEPVQDEQTLRRMALDEKIDNIGKKSKIIRRKKKGDDVDIVDSYHDEVCVRLRTRMMNAAERDKQSNDAKLPAFAKLAMLDEAMAVLRNTTLWQSIVDNGVLEAVRQWLEPIYPSGALPAVGIQKAIFEVLPKMDLDTTTLKECRLGPIVLFYTKTKRVTPAINRQADDLVQAWSRPIIKGGSGGARRRDQEEDQEGAAEIIALAARERKREKRFDARKATEENKGKKGARLFNTRDVQYTITPQSRTHQAEDLQHVSRIQSDNRKFNKFSRQVKSGRAGR
ncbi:hypothetical protein BCR39DRAFT_534575 [Naematelia encephala]|uniref:TFIIS N-terminal domain-containing protein n=1 Tax=Naematelia encephala TaxID=71784 RepID=A0A1Y2B3H2_9TREE|nr:hypothetical protein BCR39DRAFT_534575 [Naematelia encephala]